MMRAEAYYFAAQKMTKVMNEGWAAYWESTMMTDEVFAGDDEFLNYADHMAKVLASGGLNPYSLGMELWEYVENTTNRREVLERLLRVEGISWRNLTDVVDVDDVLETLEPPESIDTITRETLDQLEDAPDEWVDREALERARERDRRREVPWKVLTDEGWRAATTRWSNDRTAGSSRGSLRTNSSGSAATCSTTPATRRSRRRSRRSTSLQGGIGCSTSGRATTT